MTSNNLFGSVAFAHLFVHHALTTNRKQLSQLEDLKRQLATKYGIALNPDLHRVLEEYGIPKKAKKLQSPYLLDVPKWFGDIYEAVFGAIWLDQRQSLHKVRKILFSQIQHLMPIDLDTSSGISKITFKVLNPRRYCEQLGKVHVPQKCPKLTDTNLESYELEGENKYIGKYVCRLSLVKEATKKEYLEIGLGSTESSAIYNAATRMLDQLAQ